MVDSTSAAGTSHDTARIQEGGAASPAMEAAFANFLQYLMGWGASDRPDLGVDRYRSGLAAPQFIGVVVGVGVVVSGSRDAGGLVRGRQIDELLEGEHLVPQAGVAR
ncbi:hypothetical protein [Streptomyces rubrogriseus]|uniref:hypothetical protein n=1 Tax=Streptomyces rubrogriseus TaxID=194673 RepID=UPI0037CD679E